MIGQSCGLLLQDSMSCVVGEGMCVVPGVLCVSDVGWLVVG
jgi:hypothetical protein